MKIIQSNRKRLRNIKSNKKETFQYFSTLMHSLKTIITLILLVISCQSFSQQDYSFEKIVINYKISKDENIISPNFKKGKFIFEQTIRQINNDTLNFSFVTYWNVMMSFYCLGEDKSLVRTAFSKAYSSNPNEICSLLKYYIKSKNGDKKYNALIKVVPQINSINCENIKKNKKFDISNYCEENKLDKNIVFLIKDIEQNDQKFRKNKVYSKNVKHQKVLDSLNLKIIDSLYKKYNTYIGKSLVGNRFKHVMWAVIQHSNINKMEEYLPILIDAVKKGELHDTSLKMLIDRIHFIKFGTQIFGTQMDIEMAKEKTRKKVIAKYELEGLNL